MTVEEGRHCYAVLYDANGEDRESGLDQLAGLEFGESQLLWVDLLAPDADTLDRVWQALQLPPQSRTAIEQDASHPALGNNGEVFWVRVATFADHSGKRAAGERQDARSRHKGVVLAIIAGANFVLTIHDEPVEHLENQRRRENVDPHVGALSAESFTAALLDWNLSTYFDAAADFEMAIERLEVRILSERRLDCLSQLRHLRTRASRLRRMLAPHRVVYGGVARPDFRPIEGKEAARHFEKLDVHFERAMDVVENARELVVGSFELFSSQTALQTNRSMAILTFATVVLGMLAVLAGILGMNFDAPFFKTETTGFLVASGSMLLLGIIALVVGRMKHWF